MVVITLTCIFFTALLLIMPSSSLPIQVQSSHDKQGIYLSQFFLLDVRLIFDKYVLVLIVIFFF